MTRAELVNTYAAGVESGHFDSDLDSDTAARVAAMLRSVAYGVASGAVTGIRAETQQAYMLAMTLRHPNYDAYTRSAEILSNI